WVQAAVDAEIVMSSAPEVFSEALGAAFDPSRTATLALLLGRHDPGLGQGALCPAASLRVRTTDQPVHDCGPGPRPYRRRGLAGQFTRAHGCRQIKATTPTGSAVLCSQG